MVNVINTKQSTVKDVLWLSVALKIFLARLSVGIWQFLTYYKNYIQNFSNFDVIYKLLFGTWLRDIISSIHYVSGAVPTIIVYLKIKDLPIKRQPVIQ